MSGQSVGPEYFEQLYRKTPDPWGYGSSSYEKDKYEATIEALSDTGFSDVFEVGCSIGVLTALLAARAATVLAVDMSETALAQARARNLGAPHVSFARMQVPGDWPDRRFDLIVLSEMLYYLSSQDLLRTARCTLGSLHESAAVLLVNWLGETGTPVGGDAAAENFIDAVRPQLSVARQQRTTSYRLDLLVR